MTPIRIIIADDQKLIREGIASLLSIQDGIEVVGTAENGSDVIEKADALTPDIILMDVRMPDIDGISATVQIKNNHPKIKIIMLTTFNDDEYIIKALSAGACGYLLKDIPAADLAKAISLAHAGVFQMDPSVTGKLIGQIQSQKKEVISLDPEITPRELDVIKLIAEGLSNKEIATELFVSEGTVKNHVSSILSKLSLRDRIQIALYALRIGLIDIGQ